jgi:hypothetical protein
MNKLQAFPEHVEAELASARIKHPRMIQGAHDGYAKILEELDEFWEIVKAKEENRDADEMLKELIQTAAMCQRTAEDIGLLYRVK